MLIQAAACACYSDLATQEDTGPLVHGATRVWWPLHLAIFNILNISECNVHNITKTPVHAIKKIYIVMVRNGKSTAQVSHFIIYQRTKVI